MQITDFITPDRIACNVSASSKKRALERLSELVSNGQERVSTNDVFNTLLARERLGGTGLGHGVAIPHGRLKSSGLTIGALIKLDRGIDFDAIDNEPVDLLFALLVPEESTEEHLQALAILAAMLNNKQFCERLHNASSPDALYQLLMEWQQDH